MLPSSIFKFVLSAESLKKPQKIGISANKPDEKPRPTARLPDAAMKLESDFRP